MKRLILCGLTLSLALPLFAQEVVITDKPEPVTAQSQALKAKVQRWGTATLTLKDDKGNVTTKTDKYPIPDESAAKAADFHTLENCWNWCHNVCDGYGVCWVSCGLKCDGKQWP